MSDASAVQTARRLRSAMFVDFDNVYSGLQRLDSEAAKTFAEDPGRWVDALTFGEDGEGRFARRFLVRKCYLNPATYSRYRPNFTRAGFQVVDCPSLTQQGKSSADINLVLDAVDALGAATRFDEFVFLSADADFTPLVSRCRAADRVVTIITPGPAAAAYRAVADTVIPVDEFIPMLTAVALGDDASAAAAVDELVAGAGSSAEMPVSVDAVAAVRRLVASADRPVVLAIAAAAAAQAEPGIRESGWQGAGSFGGWLQRELPDLPVDKARIPGFIWDPDRFNSDDLPAAATASVPLVGLTPLQRQVVGITEIPALEASGYRMVLDQLAFDLALFPFNRSETAKRVRDSCAAEDMPVSRAAVSYVVSGLLFAGASLDDEPSPTELATIWAGNVLGLCRGARIELSDSDLAEITAWVSGGLLVQDAATG
ncbi:NYN domain-containing protein [Agromyces seonyuensis]|uniref:NYN domain-containing protein n=1 Tax=Agromyces seonyuensis TaxID=2662446 RepID=UPI00136636B4